LCWGWLQLPSDVQRKGRRLRCPSPHGYARWTCAKQQGVPTRPVGVSFLNRLLSRLKTIRQAAKRLAADIEGHSTAAKFSQPGQLSAQRVWTSILAAR
jgi:6-phosphogluconate dehydrogenase